MKVMKVKMKRTTATALAIAVIATLWILSGQFGGGDAPPAAIDEARDLVNVRVVASRAKDHPRRLALFGRTQADRSVTLRAETAGRVAEKLVAKGARVEKGQPLIRIAMDDRQARIREAQARVEQFRIAYKASQELARKSFKSKVKLTESLADLEAAKAQLAAIRLDAERTEIKAPFAGVVDDVAVEEGDWAPVGHELARIVDLDPIVVAAEVSERDIARVREGMTAEAAPVGFDAPFTGRVRYVSRAGAGTTRTFEIEAAFDNPGADVAEGVTARLNLTLETRQAHLVSPAALTLADDGRVGVKAVGDDGVVVFHPVEVIADAPEGVWLGGLPERVDLITVGQEFVRSGQKVRADRTVAGGPS